MIRASLRVPALPEIFSTWMVRATGDRVVVRHVINDRWGWRVSVVGEIEGKRRVMEFPLDVFPLRFVCVDDD